VSAACESPELATLKSPARPALNFLLYGYLILLVLASAAARGFALTHFTWVSRPLAVFLTSTFTLIAISVTCWVILFQYLRRNWALLGITKTLSNREDHQHHRGSQRSALMPT